MKRYGETGLLPQTGWILAPVCLVRDDDLDAVSNFRVALKMLGGESDEVEVCQIGSNTRGWIRLLSVHPNRVTDVIEIIRQLANSPVLDPQDLAREIRTEAELEWADWGHGAFCLELKRQFGLSDAAYLLLHDLSPDRSREFGIELVEAQRHPWAEPDPDHDTVRFGIADDPAEFCSRQDVARLLKIARQRRSR